MFLLVIIFNTEPPSASYLAGGLVITSIDFILLAEVPSKSCCTSLEDKCTLLSLI